MDNIGNTEHALTFADLRVHYYTGRSYLISGEGRIRCSAIGTA